ncbi:transporter [Sphingomonas naasensis]|uniref:Transporter n=1 Tax=Sphingomonas naasensis TaxID=1344951 RepID=A0A4S1WT29_9SPHN|nr:transporter [Sphingomonas naasensis]
MSLSAVCARPANAQAQDLGERVRALEELVARQADELSEQRALLVQQEARIEALSLPNDELVTYRGAGIGAMEARGAAIAAQTTQATPSPQAAPSAPVGEAPQEQRDLKAEVAAVPQEQGVLTPAGHFVLDPIFDYTQSATDRLVFRGFELIPGIQVGLIEASRARRDSLAPTLALRYGITSRLEIEGRLPYMHRYDRIQVAQQRDQGIVRTIALKDSSFGDAELALRYQINDAHGQDPIFVGSIRVKSDTGQGPFDIGYDSFGVATGLATGSGFWGVQPGLSFLLPSDPVVIFGGSTYLWHLGRDIDKTVGGAFVGHVDPGDAISANLGFGFALNPRFSFSLGYRHSYIFKTTTEIGDIVAESLPLQIGSLSLGMSYRLNTRVTANVGFEFGMTEDAPDVGITIRLPTMF